MSVTQYTIPCRYNIPKLKDTVYFVSKSMAKIINIDNGTASVTINNPSPYPMSPSKLQGFNIRLNETESLDERYKFTKTLNISILGHLTNSSFLMDDDYYLVVEDYEGNFYLINVDFPSKMTYAYTLNEAQNQTDFTFTSNSNHPLLKLNWEIAKWENCKVYNGYGIKNLKLIEKGWAKVDVEQDTITLFDHHTFKDVDFNKASCTLTENYDGSNITNTISFDIPFDNVQSSWQYNLLEFKQNLYIAEILPKNSEHALLVGYENGLQPSYNAQGGTSNGDASKITITLEETSQRGLEELINWSVVENTNKKWVYIKEIDHKNAFTCVGHGLARYDYMVETDQDGNELGNYKRFVDADASKFPYLNVVGTFDDEVTFQSSVCNCSDEYVYKFNEHYYCIDGDKVQALESIHTYDCGQSGTINGTGSPLSDYTEIGDVVEESSDFCEDEVEYMWVLKTDVSECIVFQDRWVDSGYTCSGISGYDKYLVQKKQIWNDEHGWVDTNPLITAATLVEKDSEDCGFVPFRYKFRMTDGFYSGECNASSAVSQSDITNIHPATYLKDAEIGKCVTTISDNTFERTYIMTGVTIGKNVTSIGREAFYYATGLTSVEIPSGVTSIGHAAFRYCTSLNSITCLATTPPRLVAESGRQRVFEYTNDCPIYVPCEYVDTYKAASGWSTYASRIEGIPPCGQPTPTIDGKFKLTLSDSSVVSAECDSSSAVTSGETNAYNTSTVSAVINDCVTKLNTYAFKDFTNLTTVTIPNSVTILGAGAFMGCTYLTNVTIPDSVTDIYSGVFHSCISLTNVAIPDSVTRILASAWYNCTGLTSVTIGTGITSILDDCFANCTSLTSVTVNATTPPTLGANVFSNTNDCPIYVPSGSVDTYKSARGWSDYASRIQAIP